MSTHTYTRITLGDGSKIKAKTVNTTAGNTLSKEAEIALPGKAFTLHFDADTVFEFVDTLTAPEVTTLDGVVTTFNADSPFNPTRRKLSRMRVDAVVSTDRRGDYMKVSDALAAGKQSIYVLNGVYFETSNLNVPDKATIMGESSGNVIIHFSGTASSLVADGSGGTKETAGTISITSGTTTVTGVGTTFTNLSVGDYILVGADYVDIVSIASATSLEIGDTYEGNTLSGATYAAMTMLTAVHLSNLVLTGSTVQGLHARAVRRLNIEGCLSRENSDGFHLEDCSESRLVASVAVANTNDGIYVQGGSSIQMGACSFSNNAVRGVDLDNTRNIIVDGTKITANGAEGIAARGGATRINLTDSLILCNAGVGVNALGSSGSMLIDACTIEDNGGKGVDFDGTDNILNDCIIKGNGGAGVDAGNLGVIQGCRIEGNSGRGIGLVGDSDCVVQGNVVTNNTQKGIVTNGNNNVISGNRVTGSTNEGVHIQTGATDNMVVGNHLLGNTGTDLFDEGTTTLLANNKS